jgi:molybdate transport system permease protein
MSQLWSASLLSCAIAMLATLAASLVGIPLAFGMARASFRGRSAVEALLTVPLVLPPTVVGFLILLTAGSRSPIGWIARTVFGADYSIAFTFHGAVTASAIVSLPLVYLPARNAFAGVATEMEDIARLYGANLFQVFWHVSLPTAQRGIVGGLMLAFARALGEFGATIMVYGTFPNKQTLPISIYLDYLDGDFAHALPAVLLLIAISFVIVVGYNHSPLAPRD